MNFDSEKLAQTKFVKGNFDYLDFEVTAENYNSEANHMYECENGHTGAEPALLEDSSSYNPKDGRFSISGIVVYVCSECRQPVVLHTEW